MIFLFLFNQNRFLFNFLNRHLVIIAHIGLLLRTIFLIILIAIIIVLLIFILILIIDLPHIVLVLFRIKLILMNFPLMLLIKLIQASIVKVLLLIKLLRSHLARWSLWTYWKMRGIFWRGKNFLHLRITLLSLLNIEFCIEVLSSFEYLGIIHFLILIQNLYLIL